MANLLTLGIATAILVMIPGPNVALIVANSIRYGFRMGAMTALGIRTWSEPAEDLSTVTAAPAMFWR